MNALRIIPSAGTMSYEKLQNAANNCSACFLLLLFRLVFIVKMDVGRSASDWCLQILVQYNPVGSIQQLLQNDNKLSRKSN